MGLSREQALDCFRSDDLVGIGMEADAVRRRLHPEGVVGYTIEGNVDCAAREGGSAEQDICSTIADSVDRGAAAVRLLNCPNASCAEALVRGIRERFSDLWIEAVSAEELPGFARETGLGLRDTIARLMDAGLDAIADDGIVLGGDHEDAVSAWIDVHRAAHSLGMDTVAGFVFGAGESAEQRVAFLEAVRGLQEDTCGFAAIAPKAAAAPNGRELDGVTAVERLRTLAIARMFLDTIETVQACATPQGLKVLQMGLCFGANDVGAIPPTGSREEDIRRIIRDAGFRPAQRQMGYRAMAMG